MNTTQKHLKNINAIGFFFASVCRVGQCILLVPLRFVLSLVQFVIWAGGGVTREHLDELNWVHLGRLKAELIQRTGPMEE